MRRRAQFLSPYPYIGGGLGFQYNGGRLRVGGFVQSWYGGPYYAPLPYAVMQRQIIVQPIVPVTVAPRPPVPKYDLSGIDLDVESPDKLYPPGKAPLPAPKPVANKPVPKGPEKLPVPKPEAVKPPPEDDLLKPRPIPADEAKRLIELGIRAFREGAYGLALWRFRQASGIDPKNARAFFLMGQAYLAGGQYRDAARAIEDGLRLQPDWPAGDYRPRVELYADHAEDWRELVRRLDDAVRRRPDDADYLFLRVPAVVRWAAGEAAQAFIRAGTHRRPALDRPFPQACSAGGGRRAVEPHR